LSDDDALTAGCGSDQHTKVFVGDIQGREAIGQCGGEGQWYQGVIVADGFTAIGQVLHDDPGFFIVAIDFLGRGIV
jgi:hypothetical protein